MNFRERAALRAGCKQTLKELVEIVQAEDAAEVGRVHRLPKWRAPKKKTMRPSGRLFMLNAIYAGRK